MRAVASLASLLLLSACSSALTELVVIVDTDIPNVDAIQIDVVEPDARTASTTAALTGAGAVPLPVTLGVVHRGGALSPISITASAVSGGSVLVSRSVVTGFVSGDSRVVRLDLVQSCVAVTCNVGASCTPQGCLDSHVPSETLAHFDGTTPPLGDAGPPSLIDAAPSQDAAFDANLPDAASTCEPACMLDHATATCTTSHTCAIAACEMGFSNCDLMDPTGCERSIRTATDCGGCDVPCTSADGTTTCGDGTCRIVACASATRGDCNGSVTDGCETDLRMTDAYCGSCTTPCAAGLHCHSSVCR